MFEYLFLKQCSENLEIIFLRSVGIISLIKQQQKRNDVFFVSRETSLTFLF